MKAITVLRLLDLALAGAEYAIAAKAARDRLAASVAKGGPTPAELDRFDAEADHGLRKLEAETTAAKKAKAKAAE